jgi:hypothetical protein
MRLTLAITALLAFTSSANASSDAPEYAIAVNSPVSIILGFAYGVSGYVKLAEHQALRLNVASYQSDYTWEDEGDAALSGNKRDASASWVCFPRRFLDGGLVELGALVRRHHSMSYDYLDNVENWTLDSSTLAVRGMAGWSWLIHNHAFMSLAAGASVGYEFGTATERMETSMHVSRTILWPEAYVRFGAAF